MKWTSQNVFSRVGFTKQAYLGQRGVPSGEVPIWTRRRGINDCMGE
jgi:hypothetical protein